MQSNQFSHPDLTEKDFEINKEVIQWKRVNKKNGSTWLTYSIKNQTLDFNTHHSEKF